MPAPFPHHHQTTIVRTLSSRARLEAPPRSPIVGGPPPEFDGDAGSWSAEQLLLSSIGLCLLTTFEALAARDRLEVVVWSAIARGTIQRTTRGLAFTSFVIELDMEVDDIERARATLDRAEHHCVISNALRVPVKIAATIRRAAARAG